VLLQPLVVILLLLILLQLLVLPLLRDGCGNATLTSSDGTIVITSCSASLTRTFTARDACGNTATASTTVTWTSAPNPPAIIITGAVTTLGCNPSASDISAALGSATATAACGTPAVTVNDGQVQSNGCSRSQTRTFSASDGCGNSATASTTVTWTSDQTPHRSLQLVLQLR
jgi:hypothetical protein